MTTIDSCTLILGIFKVKPSDIEFKLSQLNFGMVHRDTQSWVFVDYGKDNLAHPYQVEKNFEVLQNHASMFIRIEPTSNRQYSSGRNSDLKKSPKVHLIDAPIVEISSLLLEEH
jgi:nicotinate-nucleotide adenylyltransferase